MIICNLRQFNVIFWLQYIMTDLLFTNAYSNACFFSDNSAWDMLAAKRMCCSIFIVIILCLFWGIQRSSFFCRFIFGITLLKSTLSFFSSPFTYYCPIKHKIFLYMTARRFHCCLDFIFRQFLCYLQQSNLFLYLPSDRKKIFFWQNNRNTLFGRENYYYYYCCRFIASSLKMFRQKTKEF